jgi:hypothetical protein
MKYLVCKKDNKNPDFTKGLTYAIKEEHESYYLTFQDIGVDAKINYNASSFNDYFDLIEIK